MLSPTAGPLKLVVGVSARAAKELKLLGSRRATIAVTFTPTGGTAHRETKNVTVKRNRKGKYTDPGSPVAPLQSGAPRIPVQSHWDGTSSRDGVWDMSRVRCGE